MTLEEYKLKYPEWMVAPNISLYKKKYEWMKKDINGEIPSSWWMVWKIDDIDGTIEFGDYPLTPEQIAEVTELCKAQHEEYKKGEIDYHQRKAEIALDIEKRSFEDRIEWRKKKIKELKEDIKQQQSWILFDKKEIEELDIKDFLKREWNDDQEH